MALWTAEILSVKKNADELTLTVTYRVSDGVTDIDTTEPLVSRADKTSIWRIAQDKADYLNRVDAQKQAILDLDTDTVLGPVDLKPPPPPPPDRELIDFQAHLQTLKEVRALIAVKKLAPDAPELAAAEAAIQADLDARPEFKQYLVGI